MRDDYDDEFEDDDGGMGLIVLLLTVFALWALVIVVTWALR